MYDDRFEHIDKNLKPSNKNYTFRYKKLAKLDKD